MQLILLFTQHSLLSTHLVNIQNIIRAIALQAAHTTAPIHLEMM
ncbi:hypothetical protein [Nostoc sp. CMAA1605]|nr:hypothetical protein [Nostoc sp. CMAA1605]